MIELIIQDDGQELLRQALTEGTHRLGRTQDNSLVVPSNHLSRQHLQIEVAAEGVQVSDLGSTNGTNLRGRKLSPHTPISWPENEVLQIGSLTLRFARTIPQESPAAAPLEDAPPTDIVAHITCREAQPTRFTLEHGFATVGSGVRCDIRPLVGNIEPEHCRLTLHQNQLRVVNLSQTNPVKIGGVPVPLNQPIPWPTTQTLEVGYAQLSYTVGRAIAPVAVTPTSSGIGRWLVVLVGMGSILTVCIALIVLMTLPDQNDDPLNANDNEDGLSTPTLAPVISPTPSPVIFSTLGIDITTPQTIDTGETNDECAIAVAAEEGSGWLELPFPYSGIEPVFGGTAEQFRLISQRSRNGGRINSFFDHQYPMYPPAFGGQETDDIASTMLIFDGSLSLDAFSQDESTGGSDARYDYYSGHAGIDFSPAAVGDPRTPQTPVFAAADGFLHIATIDDDGNHMVWLSHDRGTDGNYATLYFHLSNDAFFQAMVAMPEGTEVKAGTRIGTMDTTGRSTGIHLHFEVRQDLNRDGNFTVYEKIDPYGYFPSEEYPIDPWSEPWVDRGGREREGITSQYLWLHPLVAVEEEADACLPQTEVKVDLYPVVDWTVVHPGFTYIARNAAGEPVIEGRPITRQVTVNREALVCGDPRDVRFQFIPYGSEAQVGTSLATTYSANEVGDYLFEARIRGSGQYVLAGRNNRDCTPPTTGVLVTGNKTGENTYTGPITITLQGRERGTLRSTIKEIQYSLDCGRNWQLYTTAIRLTNQSPHSCGSEGAGQGIQLGPDDFLLLAIATDSMNNIEQPIKQFRFTILSDEP